MIPLFSYLFLRGKCRYCKKKIDSLSTYMELFTGILFGLSYYVFGFSGDLFIALGIVIYYLNKYLNQNRIIEKQALKLIYIKKEDEIKKKKIINKNYNFFLIFECLIQISKILIYVIRWIR